MGRKERHMMNITFLPLNISECKNGHKNIILNYNV